MDGSIRMTGVLEPRGGWKADQCSIVAALEVVSTRSAFLILREAFYGTSRFDDFVKRGEISAPVAAIRLRELVERGLLEREAYQEPRRRIRERYRLTAMGTELFPVLAALMQWGDRWVEPSGVELRHHRCGEPVSVQLKCAAGHTVTPDELELIARGRITAA